MATSTGGLPEPFCTTNSETTLAQECSRRLASLVGSQHSEPLKVKIQTTVSQEETVLIPASAFRLLNDILLQIAKGNAVTLMPVQTELSTQQAADILNVSRPFLIEQLEKSVIPFRKVGTHRRVLLKDVMAYKEAIDSKRTQALDELTAQAQSLGMR